MVTTRAPALARLVLAVGIRRIIRTVVFVLVVSEELVSLVRGEEGEVIARELRAGDNEIRELHAESEQVIVDDRLMGVDERLRLRPALRLQSLVKVREEHVVGLVGDDSSALIDGERLEELAVDYELDLVRASVEHDSGCRERIALFRVPESCCELFEARQHVCQTVEPVEEVIEILGHRSPFRCDGTTLTWRLGFVQTGAPWLAPVRRARKQCVRRAKDPQPKPRSRAA